MTSVKNIASLVSHLKDVTEFFTIAQQTHHAKFWILLRAILFGSLFLIFFLGFVLLYRVRFLLYSGDNFS